MRSKESMLDRTQVVIVAEKYPLARASLADLLKYDGYRALQADNFGAAMNQIESVENVFAVLVDLDLVGWRTLVRQAVDGKRLVIAMRGEHFVSNGELDQRGVSVCFDKPIIYRDIAEVIKAHAAITGSVI